MLFTAVHLVDGFGQSVQLFHVLGAVDIGSRNILAQLSDRTVDADDLYLAGINIEPAEPGAGFAYLGRGSGEIKGNALPGSFDREFQLCHAIPPI